MKIHIIDLDFGGVPQTIAAFLVETEKALTLVETGPHSTYPTLKAGIEKCGFKVSDIQQVLLSHIHLDHAGAAWDFAAKGAQVYVHPIGAPHLQDPSKLMHSAKRIYLDEMDRLWGDMRAIDPKYLVTVKHKTEFIFEEQHWRAWHTPGHAVHHIAWQLNDELIFAGDVAGVRIGGGIVVPPCPPPDIHIEDWQTSIQLLRELQPTACYLTHFGRYDDVGTHLDKLEARILDWAAWMRPYFEAGANMNEIRPKFESYVQQELLDGGANKKEMIQYDSANPAWMSVAGLLRYWRKKLNA